MDSIASLEPWQAVAARKQAQRQAKILPEWRIPEQLLPGPEVTDVLDFPYTSGFFTARELELTSTTASEVVCKIAAAQWTSEEVTKAVCKRAAVAQQLVNCLTEICFDEAIQQAKELDKKLKRDGKPVGRLHGLPISLKDQFNVPGLDTTIGYISRAEKSLDKPSTLVELLQNAGALVYCKTNVPATLMRNETHNNVFGRTFNPCNRDLTPGGSSGGESALVSFGGSYLGVGTDIGGSIRDPCAYTGLFGLRPTHGRISYQQAANTYLGQEAIRSCAGPMCRSPEDIRLFMSSVLAEKPWLRDPQCLPMPWRLEDEVLPERLCFGLSMGDGNVQPCPPLQRALNIAKAKLIDAGHLVVDYLATEMPEARDIAVKMWAADSGEEFQRDTDASGEPLNPQVESWLGHSAKAPKVTVFETWQNQHRRDLFAQKWLERWEATKSITGTGRAIDGLIVPSKPFPAYYHESDQPSHYGALPSLLGLTTGCFPVTKVHPVKDVVPNDWQPISENDIEVREFYGGPEQHVNAFVGLSLIGRRLEEEKVTAMLTLIRDIVGVDY